jgi:hypothetical protein
MEMEINTLESLPESRFLEVPAEKVVLPVDTTDLMKKTSKWFIIVDGNDGNRNYYDLNVFNNELSNGIVNGSLGSENKLVAHFKNEKNEWQTEMSTVRKFARGFSNLRNLYDPIWNHALAGLKWGAYLGVALKMLDTAIMLGREDIKMALFFIGTIVLLFIPRIGIAAIIIISIVMMKFTEVNFFMMVLSAGLTGAILGCLPGMFIGGTVGLLRRNSFKRACDVEREGFGAIVKSVILPLAGSVALIYTYLFIFNPWLATVLN